MGKQLNYVMPDEKECAGECPKCGAYINEYGASEHDGNGNLEYPFTCSKCGCEGVEVHEVVYIHTEYDRKGGHK